MCQVSVRDSIFVFCKEKKAFVGGRLFFLEAWEAHVGVTMSHDKSRFKLNGYLKFYIMLVWFGRVTWSHLRGLEIS